MTVFNNSNAQPFARPHILPFSRLRRSHRLSRQSRADARVGAIHLKGLERFTEAQVLPLINIPYGSSFDPSRLDAAAQQISRPVTHHTRNFRNGSFECFKGNLHGWSHLRRNGYRRRPARLRFHGPKTPPLVARNCRWNSRPPRL